MTDLVIPNSFEAGQVAVAGDVNDNFAAVVAWSGTVVPETGAIFATTPTFPESTVGLGAYQGTHKTYVDNGMKANTGFKMISGSGTPVLTNDSVWKQVCEVSSGTAIPVNATNQTLYLTAFCDAELTSGNGPATFGLRVSFSVDGSTYGATQQISANADGTDISGAYRYAGIALTGFHSFVYSGTPQIMKAKLEIVQRASYSSVWTVSGARCRLAISREVPFA